MGKQRRARHHNNRRAGGAGTESGEKPKQQPYETIVKENALFEKYYKQLGIMGESEHEKFMETLKKPLPITFRITSYKSFAKDVLGQLKEKHFKYLDEITKDRGAEVHTASSHLGASLLQNKVAAASVADESMEPATTDDEEIYKCLPWYPNEMAWQVNLSRQDVRKNVHFDEFKQYLIHQTENGNLSRQEAVSMIPPLLLDVKPHHKILDMCASPGSKTAQLIEFLHQDKSNPIPEGFVIANDLENKRCYMLMHQLKRLESPNFMIINHDASALPNFRVESDDNKITNIMYDRILADVPCSGDGTFRKNVDVWTKWSFPHACNLHGIQFRIATRAVELLKPGGQMVYSTCSLNPVENEAVVCNLLLKFKGQIELVEARDKLPGLKTVHGLLKWNLMTKNGQIFETSEEAANSEFKNLMRPNMFPPEPAVAEELKLDRCMRVLPHHQNTGGFFIAVIRKLPLEVDQAPKKDPKSEKVEETPENGPPEADLSRVMKNPPAKRLKHCYEENPFQFADHNTNLLRDWPKIKEFFQISDDFPVDQMMTRNKKGENVRNVYFVSKQIRELTVNNLDRFKFINMGVPLFARADIKDSCNIELRINQESLDIVQKYFKRRIVTISTLVDLVKILSESTPSVNELSEALQEQLKTQCQGQAGSVILVWRQTAEEGGVNELPISFTAWLGKVTLRPLLNIGARRFFLTVVGIDQAQINEACDKIKQEDQMNSQKSKDSNPQYKAKMAAMAASEKPDEAKPEDAASQSGAESDQGEQPDNVEQDLDN